MDIEVLVATMNLKNADELLKKLKVNKSIIINQYQDKKEIEDITKGNNKIFSYKEKGISKSRNRAISKSTADIILLADDDMEYIKHYENIIKNAYEKYKDADIIAFNVQSDDQTRKISKLKKGRIGFLRSMKIKSVQITMKKKSVENIRFDENFGTGTSLYMGEENIFLFDCLKKGLKIYYLPETIAKLEDSNSTWFKGYDKEYLFAKGCQFYRMSKLFCNLLILQYSIRKKNLYKKEISIIDAIKIMLDGKKEMIRGENKNVKN